MFEKRVFHYMGLILIYILINSFILTSCATHKPCAEAGDISWPNEIKGDKVCFQKKDENGKFVNHGRFTIHNTDKKLLLLGMFENGERHGRWTQYDEKEKPVLEKYYEKGMEYTPPIEVMRKERERDEQEYKSNTKDAKSK